MRILLVRYRVAPMESVTYLARVLEKALCATGHRLTSAIAGTWSREEADGVLDAYDIVICVAPEPLLLARRRERGEGPPFLFPSWGLGPRGLTPLRHGLVMEGDGFFFPSSTDLAAAAKHLPGAGIRLAFLPFPLHELFEQAVAAAPPAIVGLDAATATRTHTLLYVGRLNAQKNVHLLVHMLGALRARGIDARLVLAGDEDAGDFPEMGFFGRDYRAFLDSVIRDAGLEDRVTFLGHVDASGVVDLYRTADIAVTASTFRTEDFGFFPIEAAAMGRPVIATAWGGFHDTVAPDVSGWRMPVYWSETGWRVDWMRGVDAIQRLVDDRALYARVGRTAAAWARSQFAGGVFAHRVDALVTAMDGTRPTMPIDLTREVDLATQHLFADIRARLATGLTEREALSGLFVERPSRVLDFMGSYSTAIEPSWRASDTTYCPIPITLDPVDGRVARLQDPFWQTAITLTQGDELMLHAAREHLTLAELARQKCVPIDGVLEAAQASRQKGLVLIYAPWAGS